eukprot:CAMPEP_0115040254 /NCGR_PEP_ID=MMETSP0216-20121206/44675_1 /TAXON_ID=223996 /ORGANISM="Protocruzia adherens, Strain Boccale" /LENGTH=512 /DNA_ID=CAMNT_0002421371 /DNA_START=90 /DNA_END=1628 /DNA_ORIENTATION=-
MLTPRFKVTQDDVFVYIILYTPYIKISDAEFEVVENEFHFYLKPYLLHLRFSGKLTADGRDKSVYHVDKGEIHCQVPKAEQGEHFENLDMMTTLLKPTQKAEERLNQNTPLIQVVGESRSINDRNSPDDLEEDSKTTNEPALDTESKNNYGFNRAYRGFFATLQEARYELADFDPDELDHDHRLIEKASVETRDFEPEHYLADFFEDEEIKYVMTVDLDNLPTTEETLKLNKKFENMYIPAKDEDSKKEEAKKSDVDLDDFTASERDCFVRLPNKEFLIKNERELLLAVFDIVNAFCYDHRTMMKDPTCETPWTITKLSHTLSSYIYYTDAKEAKISTQRRMLTYPLYRNFELAQVINKNATERLRTGKKDILKCFLNIKHLFERTEPRYLLNRLFIDDFCIWIQQVPHSKFVELADELDATTVTKDDLDFDIPRYERKAVEGGDEEESESDSDDSSEDSSSDSDSDSDDDKSSEDDNKKEEKEEEKPESKDEEKKTDTGTRPLIVEISSTY